MVRNTVPVNPHELHRKGYHLTEDIAEDAIRWLREQQAFAPDKPFLMYWAPGASHGPHHVMKEWADKYKGKFDDGWDRYRERAFARQKQLGWIPQTAKLTPRPDTLPSWESIPEAEKPFQRRLMEVFAGFTEHADSNAGRVIDEIEKQGRLDSTLVFYIWGDNGSSAEGQNGSISELIAQNGIPSTIDQHIKALDDLGGLEVLGSPKTDNMYHAGWAWAGSTPYKSTKVVAAHFGGTRQPMAVAWPRGIKPDPTPRPQFHHVIDIVPTIYEVTKITPPRVVNGVPQDSIDGVSMAYTFADPKAKGRRTTQFFDIMGSRGIYHDGGYACACGPRNPWVPGLAKGIRGWSPEKDTWALYNLDEDWSQADDFAAKMPEKLAELKNLFLVESAKNKNLPIGGGLWTPVLHPEDAPGTPYTEWTFRGPVTRMPEFTAPKLGKFNNTVTMDVDARERERRPVRPRRLLRRADCYFKDGASYEYNLFLIQRTQIKAMDKLPAGSDDRGRIQTGGGEAGIPDDVTLKVGARSGHGQVLHRWLVFTANDRPTSAATRVPVQGLLRQGSRSTVRSAPPRSRSK